MTSEHGAESFLVRGRRVGTWMRRGILMLGLPAPFVLQANAQFQEPTKEELQMTADPRAPGASAVYLYREEISDNGEHVNTEYDRVKVLTEKGKELATVSIPYEPQTDKLIDFQGRTIHADGTVIVANEKPSNLVEFKTKGFQVNSVVFTLPSVEVGSILEYRVKFRRNDEWEYLPTWEIQGSYFKHKAHYEFRPGDFLHLTYATYLEPNAKIVMGKHNIFMLDITDVPADPNEDWMPPLNSLRWRVEFFKLNYKTALDFWTDQGKVWERDLLEYTNPSGELKRAAAGIVTADDTDVKKAQKIYTAVMNLENTDFTREKSKAERKKEKVKEVNRAEDVWKQQGGSGDQLALLYVALGRAAGLKVWPIRVVDRSRALFDSSYLSLRQLDDYMAVVHIGDKDMFLDPGEKMCPFGALHWKHAMAGGLLLSGDGPVLKVTPALALRGSEVRRVADLNVDENGNVKGSVRYIMDGPEALYWRQRTLSNDLDEVKKEFNESMRAYLPEGVQAEFDEFLGLEDYEATLMGIVKVSGNIGGATGKHFFLPGLFFESRAKHPFVSEDKRAIAIDVHFPKAEQDDVTYHLPPGYTVETLPAAANISWPDHAMLKITSTAGASSVTVSRVLAYNYTLLQPTAYPNLHDFYQKVATADQQPLVLTRAAATAAKGN
jgi:hypothetical protein